MRDSENICVDRLEKLFRENYKSLCFVANDIVNDHIMAEDIVQEVFTNLWKKKDEIKINTSLKGYLYRSTINGSLNYIEKSKRSIPLEQQAIENVGALTNDLIESLNHLELEERVTQAINSLPSKCKTVFLLSRYEDMKYRQIAEHLGISIKTVENQMGKALKRMRIHLQSYLSDRSSNSISS